MSRYSGIPWGGCWGESVEKMDWAGKGRMRLQTRVTVYRHTDGLWYWWFITDEVGAGQKADLTVHIVGSEQDESVPEGFRFTPENIDRASWRCTDEMMEGLLSKIMAQKEAATSPPPPSPSSPSQPS